ncbi:MAG TPA: prolipoprotein diacylglyceryl transferase family protein [Solirubrobacterales bacterium]|nr:prolipoprotein diacylglyceryl transferase family protein [Solirubrobacterales bacterium]
MQAEIHLGPVTLQTFGIAFAIAFIAAGAVLARRLKELGKPADWAYEVVVVALVGGIVGARLNFIFENYDSVKGDLLGNIFSGSGLVWFGGAVGGAIGVALWAWRRKMLNLTLLDMCAVPLSVGYALGRIGCQVSGDGDYGEAWDGPWAMAYPNGTKPIDITVHPTPIYETLAMGLAAYFLWRLRDRVQPGILFAIYLVLAGTERLLVEFIRRNPTELFGLTQAQLISIVMIVAGVVWLAVKARRGSLTRGGAEPGPRASEAPA